MRIRDGVVVFLLGAAFDNIQIYLGWGEPTHPSVTIISALITLGTLYGICALYDRWTVVRRVQ